MEESFFQDGWGEGVDEETGDKRQRKTWEKEVKVAGSELGVEG